MTDKPKLTPEEAESLREKLRKSAAPAGLGTFQHFASDEQRQAHLDDVAAGIDRGEIPF